MVNKAALYSRPSCFLVVLLTFLFATASNCDFLDEEYELADEEMENSILVSLLFVILPVNTIAAACLRGT